MSRPLQIFLATIILTITTPVALVAADWSSTSISILHGSDYKVASSEEATILTVEHASGWKYGDNFFFFDLFQPFDKGSTIYGEWHPRLSFGKLTGKDLGFGPVRDVLLATELNVGHEVRVYLYGLGFDFDIPHFAFFSLNIFIRDEFVLDAADFAGKNDSTTFQISPSWSLPFTLGKARFDFTGFLDYAGAEGDAAANLLTAPQLLLNVGSLSGDPGSLWVGVEYQYWSNKYGIEDSDGFETNESVAQFMAKWFF